MGRRRAIATGAAAGAAAGAVALRRRSPGRFKPDLRFALDGLEAPVHVVVDAHGVPHVRARSLADAIFALGVLHARQRLWQMELLRRVVRGTLAELVGARALETDRYARVLGLARAADASAASASAEARAFAEAYCRGVNSCVEAGALHFPLELRLLLQRSVEPWTVADCHLPILLFALSLGQNFEQEIVRARLAAALGPERLAELEGEVPVAGATILPRSAAEAAARAARARAAGGGPAAGSNSFAVSAPRSASGSALLANDPHLQLGLPGAWYVADLAWDDGRAAGFSVAGLPGIVAGRTAGVAWGVTNGMIDTQDLFAVDVAPHRVERVSETIRVRRRRASQVEELQITGDGPVVTPLAPGETRALALRWTALERPLTLEPLMRALRATSGDELVAAFAGLVGPVLNVVFADRDGRIGYKLVGGPVPLRRGGDGRVPLAAGDAASGWRGTIPDAELPELRDPPEGVIVTANNRIAGEPYPHFLSAEWLPPYRAQRIADLLREAGPVSVADCVRIQVDVRSLPGLRLRDLACRYGAVGGPRARRAHAVLTAWDGELAAASAGGAVYGVLCRQLAFEVFREAGDELERFLGATGFTELSSTLGFYGRYVPRVLDLLDAADDGFFRDGRTWPEVFERCLERTAAELDERLGDDAERWRWGDLHVLVLDHPLAALPGLARVLRRGPYPLPGDADTVWQARQPPHDPVSGRRTTGPGMRYATDLGDPDATRFVLCGGQSGHPGSPAYADQVDDWLAGRTRQLAWSEAAVAALARSSIELVPADAPA